MRAAVRAAFVPFTERLEGSVPWMYLDNLGLVTTAIGNLIDSVTAAISCPFVRPDGSRATPAEIAAEWHTVKGHKTAARDGHRVLERVTTLRLTPAGIAFVVERKLAEVHGQLVGHYPAFDFWSADAQLATLSMAWACGAGFGQAPPPKGFPKLAAALQRRDFVTASAECHIDTKGPDRIQGTRDDNHGVVPRNAANRTMYRNAATVLRHGHDPETLFWPRDLPGERPTEPEIPNPPSEPTRIIDATIIRPRVPLDRPALDGHLLDDNGRPIFGPDGHAREDE